VEQDGDLGDVARIWRICSIPPIPRYVPPSSFPHEAMRRLEHRWEERP